MRPYWKGYLKLALVSCPIALHAACSSAERIALRQINKATGNRLRQQLIDEETREPVAPEHKGRGYEVAKGPYLIVEDAELEAIEIESTHTIEIDRFVPHSAIDQRFFDSPQNRSMRSALVKRRVQGVRMRFIVGAPTHFSVVHSFLCPIGRQRYRRHPVPSAPSEGIVAASRRV